MVTRSRAREGNEISVIPEIEFQPETETRPDRKYRFPCQQIVREVGLGATRPSIFDTASQYVTAHKT